MALAGIGQSMASPMTRIEEPDEDEDDETWEMDTSGGRGIIRGSETRHSIRRKKDMSAVFTIDKLPERVLLNIFCYLSHKEILSCARVCKAWRDIAKDSRLWQVVSCRPAFDGLQVTSMDTFVNLIGQRFGPSLRYIELPTDLVSVPLLHELANKCPKLQYMTLDFSTAMQLHDFGDLQSFPARLKSLSLCLSENVFLEGFLRKIYSFISSVQTLHVIGTYEKIEDEEEEVYETINLHKLKQYLPNLRVVNLWGVVFITDEHIESLSSNCAFIECLCVNFCQQVTGSSFKVVMQRLKRLKSLLLEQTSLKNKHMLEVEWEKTQIQELNITATELSTEVLIAILTKLTHLRWLSAGFLEGFNDQVMEAWLESGASANMRELDLNTCDGIAEHLLTEFIARTGHQITGLNLGGHHRLVENFWSTNIPKMPNIKTLIMGLAVDCCAKVSAKIHIDHFVEAIANHCQKIERLEVRWDSENLRFSEKSAKFIDMLRMKCLKLKSLVLSDGPFYELVRSNFERADRYATVRTTEMCLTSLVERLTFYRDLLFN
jgi:hypothetical protein